MNKRPRRRRGYLAILLIVVCLLVALAFARAGSFTAIKDTTVSFFSSIFNSPPETTQSSPVATSSPAIEIVGIDRQLGIYQNYFIGLVKEPDGVNIGSDCYSEFIILINNRQARNPAYAELLAFLQEDKTDEFHYQIAIRPLGFHFGDAEDQVDLKRLKNIIDGTEIPGTPKICSDFAERLHNNAEKSGIRCGYVTLDLGDTGHAINVFETTDKGLIYIDDTGRFLFGPTNCDKIVDLQPGKAYIPQSLFPDPEWKSRWEDMGTAANITVTWDGNWR